MYSKKLFFFLLAIPLGVFSSIFFHALPVDALTSIDTCAELQDINNNLAEDYVLGDDIDCTGFPFAPIGTFTGTLDGDGYAIQNLTITGFTNDHALFTDTDGATIEHLAITNANIQGNYQAAILVAVATNTTIYDVQIDGALTANAALSLAGAFAGRMSGGIILRSSANVTLAGYEFVGGLVGSLTDDATIKKSFATGSLTTLTTGSNATTGGLVGELASATISNSYASNTVSAQGDNVGGLVGTSQGTALVYNSYAVGSVTSAPGRLNIGGLIGQEVDDAISINSYWDTDTSGQVSSASGTGKTTAHMQDEDTFENWDFNHIWGLTSNNYPTLLPNDSGLPVLTEIQAVPTQTTSGNALYYFNASEDGEYLFTFCGADVYVDPVQGRVSFGSLVVGNTYDCSFQFHDDDGNVSNQLDIGPFTVIASQSGRGSGPTRSRALIQWLTGKKTAPTNNQNISPSLGSRTLRVGSVGEDVRALQVFLNTHGFPVAQTGRGSLGNETAFFGPKTKQALIKFQEAHSTSILQPLNLTLGTGILGKETRRVINAL